MIRFYREGVLKNIVPLILCISIVTSCMYVYSKDFLAVLTLITIISFQVRKKVKKRYANSEMVGVLFVFRSVCTTSEATPRRYSRSKILK